MFAVAVLLISGMAVRECAHFLDHVRLSHADHRTLASELQHDAVFHYLSEALSPFDPSCRCQPAVEILPSLREDLSPCQSNLLPATRAPPTFA